MAYKSTHTGPQIDAAADLALNPDTVPTSGSDALVTSDAVATVQAGLAPFENGATSSAPYAVGDLLVRAGILYKAKTAIAAGDAFTVDTNIEVATIAEVLENFNPGPDPYTSDPAMDGTASPGSSGDFSRGDHVHPHDSTIQQISAPTLTSPASENIAAGKYRVYNNLLYKVTTAITSGETASSFASKLEAVPDGGLNDLKSALNVPENITNRVTITPDSAYGASSIVDYAVYRIGGLYQLSFIANAKANVAVGGAVFEATISGIPSFSDSRYENIVNSYGNCLFISQVHDNRLRCFVLLNASQQYFQCYGTFVFMV